MSLPTSPNPYRADSLIDAMLQREERFIGLRDELEELLSRVTQERPAAVSLVGPRGMGKSFLLRFLAHPQGARHVFPRAIGPRFAAEPERVLFVPLDLGDALPPRLLEALYERLLARLAAHLGVEDARLLPLDQLPAARPTSLQVLRAQARRALAAARQEADDEELRERFAAALGGALPGALFELLQRLDAWGMRAVFLIDEFDSVAGRVTRDEYDHLRVLLGAASVVLASTRALSEQVPAAVQTSPFFNLLQRLTLLSMHFLPPDDARRLVAEPPSWSPDTAGFRFSEPDIDFILELTGLHPDLIRETCEYLYRTRHRTSRPGQDVLPAEEQPYVRALLRPLFADFFAGLWRQVSEPDRVTLAAIAARRHPAGAPIPPELVTRGYVVYEHGRYRLFAGLFRDYVLDQAVQLPPARPAGPMELTDLETRLLELLQASQGEVVPRAAIIAALYDGATDTRELRGRLDALVFRLRGKLEGAPLLIESVRGQGYRLVRRAA
ncbi:MAG TPA: winged helix-turn-helix domain-containing protein [Roseiflexaceae bacterium]|nr:winged helix-turn-helix domain-containing protein [Roseiflexaceae bacterium]